ncbi:MAG: hypothetical protein IJH76_02135 [Clostridia bacterium]|nr:hypothetical protein [Clostridia bacterium]
MSEVKMKQIVLSLYDITSIPSIIIREISLNENTQFFISNALYQELVKNSKRFCIWVESVYGGFQYSDGLEKAFMFKENMYNNNFIMQMNFVSFSNNFKQITYFATKGIRYTHFSKGMDNIVIINSD